MIILDNPPKWSYMMRAYLDDVESLHIPKGHALGVLGALPLRSSSRVMLSRSIYFSDKVDCTNDKTEQSYLHLGTVLRKSSDLYDWDGREAFSLLCDLFCKDECRISNISGHSLMRLLNHFYFIINEHLDDHGNLRGQVHEVVLGSRYLDSLGITRDTPDEVAMTSIETNLNMMGVDSVMLEFMKKPSNSNEAMAKMLIQHSAGKKFLDVLDNFNDGVASRGSRPEPHKPPANRGLPPAYQNSSRKPAWWK